jgi:hypothetical protein
MIRARFTAFAHQPATRGTGHPGRHAAARELNCAIGLALASSTAQSGSFRKTPAGTAGHDISVMTGTWPGRNRASTGEETGGMRLTPVEPHPWAIRHVAAWPPGHPG